MPDKLLPRTARTLVLGLIGIIPRGEPGRAAKCTRLSDEDCSTFPYRSFFFPLPGLDHKQHARRQTWAPGKQSLSLSTAGRDGGPPVFAPSWPLASHSGLWVGKAGRVTLASDGGKSSLGSIAITGRGREMYCFSWAITKHTS